MNTFVGKCSLRGNSAELPPQRRTQEQRTCILAESPHGIPSVKTYESTNIAHFHTLILKLSCKNQGPACVRVAKAITHASSAGLGSSGATGRCPAPTAYPAGRRASSGLMQVRTLARR